MVARLVYRNFLWGKNGCLLSLENMGKVSWLWEGSGCVDKVAGSAGGVIVCRDRSSMGMIGVLCAVM
jgi:hypothetical protein